MLEDKEPFDVMKRILFSVDDKTTLTEEQEEFVDEYFVDDFFTPVRHPLYVGQGYRNGKSVEAIMFVIAKKEEVVQEYLAKGDLGGFIFFHERPFRLQALIDVAGETQMLSDADYWDLLDSVWVDCEDPCHFEENRNCWKQFFNGLGMRDRHDFVNHLSEDDKPLFDKLDETITVYRGGQKDGFSWTLDKEKARWFANRWASQTRPKKDLWQGEIAKSEISWFTNSRSELEVVIVNPEIIKNLKKLENK